MQQSRPVRVVIDSNLCVGSSMCVTTHPNLFVMQPDGHAAYVADVIDLDAALEAEELCPVTAIRLVYED